jgi:hypothetical protein
MILSYQECINKYDSDYKIKKELSDGKLSMEEKDCTPLSGILPN